MEREAREERLRTAVRRLWGCREVAGGGSRSGVELGPGSAYEAVTRQMVEDLGREIAEIKGRLNGLLFMVAGAIVVDVVLRLVGA